MILNVTNAVFDQSGSTFDNMNTLLFNAALLVSVPLVIYDVVSHFTEDILQKQTTSLRPQISVKITCSLPYLSIILEFGFYPPCMVRIVQYLLDIVEFTQNVDIIFKALTHSKKTSVFFRCSG